jgi:hypothetical protein
VERLILVTLSCDECNVPSGFEPLPDTKFWCGAHWGVEAIGGVEQVQEFAFGDGVVIGGEVFPVTVTVIE